VDFLLHSLVLAIPALLNATLLTAGSSLLAGLLAMTIAIPVAFARLSKIALLRSIATFYVETIRGTPLLLQLLVWYYGVRELLLFLFNLSIDTQVYNVLTAVNSNSLFPRGGVSSLFFAVVGLGFNYGAYLAEVIRGGIQAVPQGQIEAAQTLGLSRWQTSRLIVLPQALRIMIPPLTNNFITLIQDTAFLQVLGVAELSLVSQSFAVATSNIAVRWEFYIVELVIYFILCYSLALLSRRSERRQAHMALGAQ
jgi:His/Glu/Gln/Arg/opine family amino acid ABC transporter permease subunit